MSNMYYLAAPYTDPSAAIRAERVRTADMVAAALMEQHGFCIYSPLTHSQAIVPYLQSETVQSHAFWMRQCLPMVKAATALIILPLPGWKQSKGLHMELAAAKALFMPVYTLQSHAQSQASAQDFQQAAANDALILYRVPQERDILQDLH